LPGWIRVQVESGLSGFTFDLINMDQRVQGRFGKEGLGLRFGQVRMSQGSGWVRRGQIKVQAGLGYDE
jgi:hypothetical protein